MLLLQSQDKGYESTRIVDDNVPPPDMPIAMPRQFIDCMDGSAMKKSEAQTAPNGPAVLAGTLVLAMLLGCQSTPLPPISP